MSLSISYPYTLDSSGVVTSTADATKIYLDKVITLLSTNLGQRPLLPTYGVDWSSALFENDNNARKAIPQAIRAAVARWLPEITINNVIITNNNYDGIENVNIILTLPDNTTSNLVINSGTFNYNGTLG